MREKALLVYAHCDDELLWGHPWLLGNYDTRVLICSSDKTNPERQEYRRGPEALAAVCERTGVERFLSLDEFNSEFYRLKTRGPGSGKTLKQWWDKATEAIQDMSEGCNFIATHNPHGEYGHIDHLMVRRAVMSTATVPVKWTSALVETSTWPVGVGYIGDYEYSVRSRSGEFSSLKEEYVSRACWTWSSEEPMSVSVYSSDNHLARRVNKDG